MNTAFQTGPGFYAADTFTHDRKLPNGVMRIYCARIEAYDLPILDRSMDEISFEQLAMQAENNPHIAKALLKLGEYIELNKEGLRSLL